VRQRPRWTFVGNWLPAGVAARAEAVPGGTRTLLVVAGTNVRVTLPGQGTLELVAGMVLTDATGHLIADGGRLDVPPTPELCAALAG
jgi:hypothetical protein